MKNIIGALFMFGQAIYMWPYFRLSRTVFAKEKKRSCVAIIAQMLLAPLLLLYLYPALLSVFLVQFFDSSRQAMVVVSVMIPLAVEPLAARLYSMTGEKNSRGLMKYTHICLFAMTLAFGNSSDSLVMAIVAGAIVPILMLGIAFHKFVPAIRSIYESKVQIQTGTLSKGPVIVAVVVGILTSLMTLLFEEKPNSLSFLSISFTTSCVLLVAVIIVGAESALKNVELVQHEIKQKEDLAVANAKLQETVLMNSKLTIETVKALVRTIEAKDEYTKGHSDRVAKYSVEIARRALKTGKLEDDIYTITICALLHDIGKIAIPDNIINKTGKLTDDEFEKVKSHPQRGYEILKGLSDDGKLSTGALYHHEKYNGKGYPNGVMGTDIPELARIIAVADAYDAMTSKRSYREPLSQAEVREQIERNLGEQFDPRFGRIMLNMIDEDKAYELRA